MNLVKAFFSNVHCESGVYGVYIVPSSSSEKIYQVFFNNCEFFRTQFSTSLTAGVYIDTNHGVNKNVSDIFFNNCMCHDWLGPGIQINSGQDIVITGGRYGSNATGSGMSTSGGIAVSGGAERVSIIGADCSGQIPSYNSQPPGSSLQPYGISVTGAVVSMQIRGCNLTNSGTGPLYVPTSGTPLDLRVTDCVGYNDIATPVTSTAPASGLTFNGASYYYYGPVAFYVWGGTGTLVTIDGHTTPFVSGGFTLGLGETAVITYNILLPKPTFFMIGR